VKKLFFLCAVLFIICGPPAMARNAVSIRIDVTSHPVLDSTLPQTRVIFADEPVIVEAAVNFVSIPDDGASRPAVAAPTIPSTYWWKSFHWSLRERGRGEIPFPPDATRVLGQDKESQSRRQRAAATNAVTLRSGERPTVKLNIGILPVGDYTLAAEFDGHQAGPERFNVRTGGEDRALRHTYADYRLRRARSYGELQDFTAQLAEFEPLNAGIFETVGDAALVEGSLAEADTAYAKAEGIVRARREQTTKQHGELEPKLAKSFQKELDRLARVRQMLPNYFAHRSTMAIEVTRVGAYREYRLVDRSTHKLIQRID